MSETNQIEIELVKNHNKAKKGTKVTLDENTCYFLIREGIAKATDKKDADSIAAKIKADNQARELREKKD